MTKKGDELNKRVWELFAKAGFETKPNANNPNEPLIILSEGQKRTPDLSASVQELGVKIIGENTTEKKLKKSFTTYVHDIEKLMGAAKAKGGLLVFIGVDVTEQNKRYAKRFGVRVWDEDELRYYEAVAEAIHEYARYEIIHAFGITTDEEKNIHNVLALRFKQPYTHSGSNLFIFTITPDKLLRTCVIYRRAQGNADYYQRMVKKARLVSVKKFVTSENALLPPNIIVHFSRKVIWDPVPIPKKDTSGNEITLAKQKDYELGVLSIPLEYASLELIDGQHRLYGFVDTELATKENFNLVALGMKGLRPDRKRNTFVAINANSVRVDPNLVAFLKYTDNEAECQKYPELMAIKIVVELNKTTPFKNRIRLLDIGNQNITLKGFSGYDLVGLLGQRGLLRKHYPDNKSQEYVKSLRVYFGILECLFKKQAKNPDKYIIFTNRGISAFLKLLKSILKDCQCPLDENIVNNYLQPLKDNWKGSWEIKKLKSAYVGSKGWKDFHRDLVSAIHQVYPDFQE